MTAPSYLFKIKPGDTIWLTDGSRHRVRCVDRHGRDDPLIQVEGPPPFWVKSELIVLEPQIYP